MSADSHPVALVTGGSRGIGRAVVATLARSGVDVYFTYVANQAAASELEEEVRARGGQCHALRVDGRDNAACSAAVDDIIRDRERLDVVVNNAAVTADKLLSMMSYEEWSKVVDTSLNGLFGITKPAAKQMMRQRGGRIINVTSVSGLRGVPGQANYSAVKAAIIGFTRTLAVEVAGSGVSVNAVAPGFVETDMLGTLSDTQRKDAVRRVPMRRLGNVEEIANVVHYLALAAPAYLTAHTLVVDGGLSARL